MEPKDSRELKETQLDYTRAAESSQGAIMLAVFRGGLSEGANLADASCRGVVIAGLPLPPPMGAKVKLKREFLNELHGQSGPVSGDSWYNRQAIWAVNQALGRAIRHTNDYGAVILCESRFCVSQWSGELSAWARPALKVYDSFEEGALALKSFFAAHQRPSILEPLRKAEAKSKQPRMSLFDALGKRPLEIPQVQREQHRKLPPEKPRKELEDQLLDVLLASKFRTMDDLAGWFGQFRDCVTACGRYPEHSHAWQGLRELCTGMSPDVLRIAESMVARGSASNVTMPR